LTFVLVLYAQPRTKVVRASIINLGASMFHIW